ncbi:MAG: hypothetical protein ACOCXT_05980, partial [Candidatus Dojkabacteria bacterium]
GFKEDLLQIETNDDTQAISEVVEKSIEEFVTFFNDTSDAFTAMTDVSNKDERARFQDTLLAIGKDFENEISNLEMEGETAREAIQEELEQVVDEIEQQGRDAEDEFQAAKETHTR